jgi:hypothetical protein
MAFGSIGKDNHLQCLHLATAHVDFRHRTPPPYHFSSLRSMPSRHPELPNMRRRSNMLLESRFMHPMRINRVHKYWRPPRTNAYVAKAYWCNRRWSYWRHRPHRYCHIFSLENSHKTPKGTGGSANMDGPWCRKTRSERFEPQCTAIDQVSTFHCLDCSNSSI